MAQGEVLGKEGGFVLGWNECSQPRGKGVTAAFALLVFSANISKSPPA